MPPSTERIIMYGCRWCSDTISAQSIFQKLGIDYQYIDIDSDEKAAEFVVSINHGNRSVPTILFPDGSILVEPRSTALREKLNAFLS